MNLEKPFVTKAEAARRCGVARLTIYEWLDLGIISADGKGRIPRDNFERWLATRTGTSDA